MVVTAEVVILKCLKGQKYLYRLSYIYCKWRVYQCVSHRCPGFGFSVQILAYRLSICIHSQHFQTLQNITATLFLGYGTWVFWYMYVSTEMKNANQIVSLLLMLSTCWIGRRSKFYSFHTSPQLMWMLWCVSIWVPCISVPSLLSSF